MTPFEQAHAKLKHLDIHAAAIQATMDLVEYQNTWKTPDKKSDEMINEALVKLANAMEEKFGISA